MDVQMFILCPTFHSMETNTTVVAPQYENLNITISRDLCDHDSHCILNELCFHR